MFYPNLLNLRDVTFQKLDFSSFAGGINTDVDDSVLPVKYSKVSYNYNYADGALKDGIGIGVPKVRFSKINSDNRKVLEFPYGYSVEGAWLFNAWSDDGGLFFPLLVIYCGNGKLYYNYLHSTQTIFHEIIGINFTEKPNIITYNLNGVDTLIVVSDADGMYTWTENGGAVKIDKAPKINSMAIHYERLFVTETENPRRVWFSDDLNPANFNVGSSEGGFIDIIDDFGRSNKVVSFNGYLYIFRDYNIAKLAAYANQEDFMLTQLYVGNGKIFAGTVCVCGDKIMYLASDGLYVFNGTSASKVNLGIGKFFKGIDNKYAKAGYSDGCYYLACRMNFEDDLVGCELSEYRNNVLLKVDVSTGEISILRGYDVVDVCVINDTLGSCVLCVVYDGTKSVLGMIDFSGSVFENATTKVWKSPYTDFGYPNNDKIISEIHINTLKDLTIEFNCDGKIKSCRVKGKEGVNVVKPYIRGKKFSIKFISNGAGVKIESPQIKVGIL